MHHSVIIKKYINNYMKFTYEIVIRTSLDKLFDALTDPNKSKLYYYGFEIYSDWQKGSKYEYKIGDMVCIDGIIKDLVSGKRIEMSFNGKWVPEVAADGETTVIWEMEQKVENVVLKLIHDDLVEGSYSQTTLPSGWALIISGLKSYLETGKALKSEVNLGK
jgi:uncharacterized protein YndB with AHSA1/START domain